jgi:hypothetical protein
VFSATPINVTTVPSRKEGGIVIEPVKGAANTYEVTLRRVQQNLFVDISSATSSSADGDGTTTGNALVKADAVWAASGVLTVQSAKPATVSVFSVTGQLLQQVSVNGTRTLTLPKGLFIVQMNGKAFKVIN